MEEVKEIYRQSQEETTAHNIEVNAAEPKEEKPKKKTNVELLDEAKKELKETQQKVKELKEKKDKTDKEKAELKTLQAKLSSLKVEKAKLQKKIDTAKQNAVIKSEEKKLADSKQEAIRKVLEAEELNTENGVKAIIELRRTAKRYGIKNNKQFVACLEYIKQNAPHLINNGQ